MTEAMSSHTAARDFRAFARGGEMNRNQRLNHVNDDHKRIVEAGGGIYVRGMLANLVLFNSPQTRSTLALPEDKVTAETVRAKIADSNKSFGIEEAQ